MPIECLSNIEEKQGTGQNGLYTVNVYNVAIGDPGIGFYMDISNEQDPDDDNFPKMQIGVSIEDTSTQNNFYTDTSIQNPSSGGVMTMVLCFGDIEYSAGQSFNVRFSVSFEPLEGPNPGSIDISILNPIESSDSTFQYIFCPEASTSDQGSAKKGSIFTRIKAFFQRIFS